MERMRTAISPRSGRSAGISMPPLWRKVEEAGREVFGDEGHVALVGEVDGRVIGGVADLAIVVMVEALTRLAAKIAGFDHALLDGGGAVAALAEECLVNRLGDGEVDVYANEVHQLERAHAEACGAHGSVYCRDG
jgi:hypothetical protein